MKRKKTKQIAKVSDFADKLFRLNMIVSYKPNLSVVYGWLIQTVEFTNSLWNVKSFYWCRLLWWEGQSLHQISFQNLATQRGISSFKARSKVLIFFG